MNHYLIQSLVDLYKQLPESSPELAARRVAVLIEMELSEMEKSGEEISRSSLQKKLALAMQKHKASEAA